MIDKHERHALVKALSGVVREFVASAVLSLTKRFEELEVQVKEIPAGEPGPAGPKGDSGSDGVGISSLSIEQSEDGRRISISIQNTIGEEFTREILIPAIIYRGVYKAEHQYTKGDVVTYSGCAWHCNVDTTQKAPKAEDSGWQLMVKSGRDGKDLREVQIEPDLEAVIR